MDYFRYKNGELYAEDLPVRDLAGEFGSPLFIYSHRTLERHLKAYDEAFSKVPNIICFAAKSNSNGAILRLLARNGGGADVVSGGELYRALRAGIPPKKIVYAGVGKTDEEIIYALKKKILMFNVESDQELVRINELAAELGVKAPIALRVNPDIDPETHPYISTGLKQHKFGIPIENGLEYYRLARNLKNIHITGIHKHIGSQITKTKPFVDALKRVILLIERLREEGIVISHLDIGGGLGIQYLDERPPLPGQLADEVIPLLKEMDITLVMEPGRSIVGNAGILLTKVLYIKKGEDRDFVVVDAGMNDLLRPTLYSAYHHIIPLKRNRRKKVLSDIVGPICESGDYIAKGREINNLLQGEYLAVLSTGAYGFSMSSNYNSRPRPAEVLVKGREYFLIKERELYRDLLRGERIPEFLK